MTAERMAPRRPLCARQRQRRRGASRADVAQAVLRARAEVGRDWAMALLRAWQRIASARLTGTEKLMLLYLCLRMQQWPQVFEHVDVDEVCLEAAAALDVSVNKMALALDSLANKGALDGIPYFDELRQFRRNRAQLDLPLIGGSNG